MSVTAPQPPIGSPAPAGPPTHRIETLLVVAALAAALALIGYALVNDPGAIEREPVQREAVGADRPAERVAPTAQAESSTGASEQEAQAESAAPLSLETEMGTMRVVKTRLAKRWCPPFTVPSGCETAPGSDRFLVLWLRPAEASSTGLTDAFTDEVFSSTVTSQAGVETTASSVAESTGDDRIQVVYGPLSESSNEGSLLVSWPNNPTLEVTPGVS